MKPLFALLITCCLFGCREKEDAITGFPYGLVGTYEVVSNKPSFVFKNLLSNYDNFNETTTAIISQTGIETYRLEIKVTGVAKKGNANAFNYNFTADLNGGRINNVPNEYRYGFGGKYGDIIPSSLELGNVNKHIESTVIRHGLNLNIFADVHYGEDRANIINATLVRIK